MKRIIALTLILTMIPSPAYAKPQYSEVTKKLMQEAGQVIDYDVDEVMSRQEALKSGKANKTALATQNSLKTAQRSLKTANDEYRVVSGSQSVKVTDTSDGLHIYSNDYEAPSGYSKYSYDEFSIGGKDTPANDGYGEGGFDELHINRNYLKNVWKPDHKVLRINIDEFRLPNEM